jgi:hypothetical protein
MLFREIIAVYSGDHTKHTHTKWRVDCWSRWYVYLPLGFKGLNRNVNRVSDGKDWIVFQTDTNKHTGGQPCLDAVTRQRSALAEFKGRLSPAPDVKCTDYMYVGTRHLVKFHVCLYSCSLSDHISRLPVLMGYAVRVGCLHCIDRTVQVTFLR